MSDFVHLAPHRTLRALTLTGGGVRGIFSIRLLDELERAIQVKVAEQFDLFCGTSIGGILCLGLAIGKTGRELATIFADRAFDIFGHPRLLNPWGIRGAKHKPDGLRAVVKEVLGSSANTKISELDKTVVIIAVNASINATHYFGNVSQVNGMKCNDASLLDVALATSAAPLFFPPHRIDDSYFLDGGIVSNNPDMEAFLVGTEHFARTNQSLKILSIGTGTRRLDSPSQADPDPGTRSWLKRFGLVDRLMSLQAQKPSHFVGTQLGTNYYRIDAKWDRDYELDDCSVETLASLSRIGHETANDILSGEIERVAVFFR